MTPSNDLTGVERLVRRMNLKLLYENRYRALWDGNITPDLLPRLEAEYRKEFGQ